MSVITATTGTLFPEARRADTANPLNAACRTTITRHPSSARTHGPLRAATRGSPRRPPRVAITRSIRATKKS